MQKNDSYLWKMTLVCFILAGLTGFVFRLGMAGWDIGGLDMANIRHAHSHLMFFGWAVPLPLFILMNQIRQKMTVPDSSIKWMKNSILWGLIFGMASYPFFLIYGYKPVVIGSATMPLSVVFSGMVMLSWYAFMIGYLKARNVIKDANYDSTSWFDGALILLFVCSLGAWGVGIVQGFSGDNQLLMKGLTHFFLSTFTEGWLVLVLIAILSQKLKSVSIHSKWMNLALTLIVIGAPLTFPYGITQSLFSPLHLATARIGGALVSIGLGIILYEFLKVKSIWRSIWIWPILLLATKALMQITASIIPSAFWLSDHGLRIFYLHILLLGAYTLTMIGWIFKNTNIPKIYYSLVQFTIFGTLVSLILPTGLFPASWSGMWIIDVLALFALLPVIAMSVFFGKVVRKDLNLES